MMRTIEVKCPVCAKEGTLEISEQLKESAASGILKVQVLNHPECGHSFLIHLDRNYAIRGYSKYDFVIDAKKAQMALRDEQSEEISFEPGEQVWIPKLDVPADHLDIYFAQVLDGGANILERQVLTDIFRSKKISTKLLLEHIAPISEALSIRITKPYVLGLCQKFELSNLIMELRLKS